MPINLSMTCHAHPAVAEEGLDQLIALIQCQTNSDRSHISCGYCDRHCLIAVCNYCFPPSSHYPGSGYVPLLKVTDSRCLTKWQSASAASQSPAQAAGHSSLLHWNRRRHHRCSLALCHLPAWFQPATRSSSQAATRRNQFI